jgi:hypothetical protein
MICASIDSDRCTLNSDPVPERREQDRLPPFAQLGRIVFPRRIDEAGQEAFERITAHEQPKPLPLAKMQDPHRMAQQVVLADLEQLVTRIRFEDVGKRLGGVAA